MKVQIEDLCVIDYDKETVQDIRVSGSKPVKFTVLAKMCRELKQVGIKDKPYTLLAYQQFVRKTGRYGLKKFKTFK